MYKIQECANPNCDACAARQTMLDTYRKTLHKFGYTEAEMDELLKIIDERIETAIFRVFDENDRALTIAKDLAARISSNPDSLKSFLDTFSEAFVQTSTISATVSKDKPIMIVGGKSTNN